MAWVCKKCGRTDFIAYLDGHISAGTILRDKNFVVSQENVIGFECYNCNDYSSEIEEIAEWVEDED